MPEAPSPLSPSSLLFLCDALLRGIYAQGLPGRQQWVSVQQKLQGGLVDTGESNLERTRAQPLLVHGACGHCGLSEEAPVFIVLLGPSQAWGP